MIHREGRDQCDQIGQFFKFLLTTVPSKVVQIFVAFWAILKHVTFKYKLLWLLFDKPFGTFGLLLIQYPVTLVATKKQNKFNRVKSD